ncbi:coth protein-domain-containing protein [Sporodiniella umbellata]|nr:coth protein-domain-containing protein [Sporodiniella umbellata]
MKSLSFIAVSFLVAVNAASVSFKVIAPNAKSSVQVNVNGALTTLEASDPDVPYYTGSAELNDGQSYKYVVDGTAETFDRVLNGGSTSTKNEFFERPVTYANLPTIPKILSEGSWTRGDQTDALWDSNYVPSVFVTGAASEMNNLIENVAKETYKTKITYIDAEKVTTIEGCDFRLHKPGKKKNDAKQSWVWTLPEGKTVAKRSWFKIRHMEEDPTQLREKLYADIARQMGTYANQANMVRFFINKEGMGTFNMLDDVIAYSYINAMFYNGQAPAKKGALYDGASGASFNASGTMDSFIPAEGSPLDQDALMPMAQAFAAIDFSNDAQVKGIAKFFDYDQFLRFMVMEFLTGDWDGYWQEQTNDGAYIDPNDNNKVYYLAQDFDATFGVNLAQGREFVKTAYTDFPQQFPGGILINKLLTNPGAKATFESYLKTTVQEIFNNATLGAYVTARHDFLAPDLRWDRSIKQRSPGNVFGWTFEQTQQNLFEGVIASATNTGGAEWGLLEWVMAKEKAVREQLHITGGPTPAKPSVQTQTPAQTSTDSHPAIPAVDTSATLNNQAASTSAGSTPYTPSLFLLATTALFISFF